MSESSTGAMCRSCHSLQSQPMSMSLFPLPPSLISPSSMPPSSWVFWCQLRLPQSPFELCSTLPIGFYHDESVPPGRRPLPFHPFFPVSSALHGNVESGSVLSRSSSSSLPFPPSSDPSIGCVHLNDSACSSSFSFPSPIHAPFLQLQSRGRCLSCSCSVVQITAAAEFLLPPSFTETVR